jgi:hypothetical protein
VAGCAVLGILVKRYVRQVADFAVAGRSVGVNMGVAGMTCCGTGSVGGNEESQVVCPMIGERHVGEVLLYLPEGPYQLSIRDGKARLYLGDSEQRGSHLASLTHVEPKSATLGATAPKGAIVLFDGKSADAWVNGRVENGLLPDTNIKTKQAFRDYQLHLEFRTPYMPPARADELLALPGSKYANASLARAQDSGEFYHQGRYGTLIHVANL